MTTLDERIEAARKLEGYTPGPWYQGSHIPESASVWIGGRAKEGGGAVLPYLAKTMNWPANYSANARLIAAAPDLHRLVLDLAAERERLLAENERMREALAGLSNALELPQHRGVLTLVPEALERARAALASEPRA